MFTENEQTNLRELATTMRQLAAQIYELSYVLPGAETQTIDIIGDARQVLLRQERVLQFIQVDAECRI